jgi:hypothetical protein
VTLSLLAMVAMKSMACRLGDAPLLLGQRLLLAMFKTIRDPNQITSGVWAQLRMNPRFGDCSILIISSGLTATIARYTTNIYVRLSWHAMVGKFYMSCVTADTQAL